MKKINKLLSEISSENNNNELVGRLLTTKEVDFVSGAGAGGCGGPGGSHKQTGGSYTQSGGGSYTQSGGTYDMTCPK